MNMPAEPIVIADIGRLVVAEDGPRILLIDRGRGPSEVTTFVLVVLTLVCGGIGTVSMFYAVLGSLAGPSVVIGAVLLLVGMAAGAGMLLATRSLRRTRLTPLSNIPPVATFDRERRVYLDEHGEIVAPLDHVRFERRSRPGSPVPTLVATTPSGDRVLLHGTVFGGSIGNLDDVLGAAVRRPPPDTGPG